MWIGTTRPKSERRGLRYASDMTDGEWNVTELLLPAVKRLGRPRTTDLREASPTASVIDSQSVKTLHSSLDYSTMVWSLARAHR